MDSIFTNDFKLTQNRLGSYISLSVWAVSLVFCFYYLAMGAQLGGLLILAGLAVVGIGAARLFHKNKNTQAVLLQCACMYLSLICVLSFPVIGQYAVMTVLIIALTPVILMNVMHSGIIFSNLVIALLLLSIHELTGHFEVDVLEKILDFFIKFMVIIFVFVQVYGLRLLFERTNHRP
ncbi:hypothetical protein D3C87_1102350 [compost metagenome]